MDKHPDMHPDQRPDLPVDRQPRPWKAILAALVAGVLLGGTLAVTQPAIAAAPLKWAKVWKQEIKPRADKRYYTKKRTEKRYERKHKVLRGTYAITEHAAITDASDYSDAISFGRALASAPTAHYIPFEEALPTGCTGTPANPGALPGHLCFFEQTAVNVLEVIVLDIQDNAGQASTMGAILRATALADGPMYVYGSWAATPSP